MSGISKQPWGTLPSGEQILLYTLRNSKGFEARITNFGGRLVVLKAPDKDGKFEDVVLGFDDLQGYLNKNPFFGALVGRYANRIANGQFTLDGKTYKLAQNNGPNTLHGGLVGFDKVAWRAEESESEGRSMLRLNYLSRDGEEGFPGNLQVSATYSLGERNELRLDYHATSDSATVLNLTNHSYFDLGGQFAGTIVNHEAQINAQRFTPVNGNLIPTGELRGVEGTPFDFRKPTQIAARIDQKDEQLGYAKGYDHNFVLDHSGDRDGLATAARVTDPKSGRVLEVLTTQPGMQFYTGNHLPEGIKGKGGSTYGFRYGFCVETQHFPDSPNQKNFPSTRLDPDQFFRETTLFRFSVA